MFLMITTEEFFRTSWEQYWCLLGISIDFKLELPSTVVPFYKFLANELHWISKKEAYVANTTKLSMTLSLSISYSAFFSFPKKKLWKTELTQVAIFYFREKNLRGVYSWFFRSLRTLHCDSPLKWPDKAWISPVNFVSLSNVSDGVGHRYLYLIAEAKAILFYSSCLLSNEKKSQERSREAVTFSLWGVVQEILAWNILFLMAASGG